MTRRIRFEHKTVGQYHVITSPDLVGFHVTGLTPEEAERAAVSVVDFLRRSDEKGIGRLKSVALEYDAA